MWVKVCGFTDVANTVNAVRTGIDAVGLNFFEGSKRFVTPATAESICRTLKVSSDDSPTVRQLTRLSLRRSHMVDVVGLFVNSPAEDVIRISQQLDLDAIQFHGGEGIDDIQQVHRECDDITVIRAVRVNRSGLEEAIQHCRGLAVQIPNIVFLLDALVAGQFGGTGAMVDPDVIDTFCHAFVGHRVVIAGGLTPETVSSVVTRHAPWGVDTASGVEDSPGQKNIERVEQFIANAKRPRC
ncbi:MAG: phosphoribosylanthranilate isomerase [Planctomycetaceae bacterium]